VEPCGTLQRFVLDRLAMRTPTATTKKEWDTRTIQIVSLSDPSRTRTYLKRAPRIVTLHYCPFCGTRLIENDKVQAWMDKRLG
jgi:hypothetical protein